ncbi:UNVERIFIED_CONTAM: hypothetical protein K2H54_048714, partial [Gekko kuhli]
MAPKKGSGQSKGKQPVPKKPVPKRPAPTQSSSDDDNDEVQQAILSRLQAVEQAMGVQASQAVPGDGPPGRKETRSAAKKRFQAEVLTRLSLVEGRAGTSAVATEAPDQSDGDAATAKPPAEQSRPTEPVAGPSSST